MHQVTELFLLCLPLSLAPGHPRPNTSSITEGMLCAVAISAEDRQKCAFSAVGSSCPLLMSVRVPELLTFPKFRTGIRKRPPHGCAEASTRSTGRQSRAQPLTAHAAFADAAVATKHPGFCPRIVDRWKDVGVPDSALPLPAPLGGLRDPSNTQADLRVAFQAAGSEWVTSHVLRKTVATLMEQAGLSARAAADQLGHAKPSMTSDRYFGRGVADTGCRDGPAGHP